MAKRKARDAYVFLLVLVIGIAVTIIFYPPTPSGGFGSGSCTGRSATIVGHGRSQADAVAVCEALCNAFTCPQVPPPELCMETYHSDPDCKPLPPIGLIGSPIFFFRAYTECSVACISSSEIDPGPRE